MLKHDQPVPWNFPCTVKVGLNDVDARCILHYIDWQAAHGQRNQNLIFSRSERKAWNVTNECSLPLCRRCKSRLKNRMSRKDSLSEHSVKTQGCMDLQLLLHLEADTNAQWSAHPHTAIQGQI